MSIFDDIGSWVDNIFADESEYVTQPPPAPQGGYQQKAYQPQQALPETDVYGNPLGTGMAWDNYPIDGMLGSPQGSGTAWDQYDTGSVIDMADESWNVDWDSMFNLDTSSPGQESDESLLGAAMNFAESKTGQGLIGGLLGMGGQYLLQAADRDWREEQERLAHQRRLEAMAASRSGGGRGRPSPGSADVTKSNLARNLVRR